MFEAVSDFFIRKKRVVFTVVACLLIALGAGYTAYANLDRIISPRKFYLYVEGKNAFSLLKELPKSGAELENGLIKSLRTNKKMDVTFDSRLSNSGIINIDDMINKLNIVVKTKGNAENGVYETAFNYDNREILKTVLFKDKNTIGLQIPTIYDKFVTFDSSRLKEAFQNLGLDTEGLPDRIISQSEINSALDIDKKVVSDLISSMADIYMDGISEESVSIERNVAVKNSSGHKTDTIAISIEFDQETIKATSKKWIEVVKSDDALAAQIVKVNNNLCKLYKEAGYKSSLNLTELTVQEVEAGIIELAESINNSIDKLVLKDKLQYTVYVDKSDRIIQRSLKADAFSLTLKALGDSKTQSETTVQYEFNNSTDKISIIAGNSFKYDRPSRKINGVFAISMSQDNSSGKKEDMSFGINYNLSELSSDELNISEIVKERIDLNSASKAELDAAISEMQRALMKFQMDNLNIFSSAISGI